jgi:hypothetical protein
MEVVEGEEVEDVEDEESAAAESRLARKVASFGMVRGGYYTPGRMNSEDSTQPRTLPQHLPIQIAQQSASYGFHFPVTHHSQFQTIFRY